MCLSSTLRAQGGAAPAGDKGWWWDAGLFRPAPFGHCPRRGECQWSWGQDRVGEGWWVPWYWEPAAEAERLGVAGMCVSWGSQPLRMLHCPTELCLQNIVNNQITKNFKTDTAEPWAPSAAPFLGSGTFWRKLFDMALLAVKAALNLCPTEWRQRLRQLLYIDCVVCHIAGSRCQWGYLQIVPNLLLYQCPVLKRGHFFKLQIRSCYSSAQNV